MISNRWDALFCVLLWPLLVVFVVCRKRDKRKLMPRYRDIRAAPAM